MPRVASSPASAPAEGEVFRPQISGPLSRPLLALDPWVYARIHGAAIVFLVIASLAGQVSRLVFNHDHLLGLVRDFDLDNERNVPTWFQSTTLLLGAFLAVLVARLRARLGPHESTRWRLMIAGLVLMSIDEAISLHERLTVPVEYMRNVPAFHPFSWVIPGTVLVLLAAAYYLPWLRTLPPEAPRRLMLAGALYVGGAVGLEAAGGVQALTTGVNTWLYVWTYTAEETLEMLGGLVLNFTLLEYLRNQRVAVAVQPARSDAAG